MTLNYCHPFRLRGLVHHSHSINIYRYIHQNTESYITKIKHHSEIFSQFFSIFQRIGQMSALVPSKSSKMHAKTPQLARSRCSSCCTVTTRKWLSIKLWRHHPAFLIQLKSTIYAYMYEWAWLIGSIRKNYFREMLVEGQSAKYLRLKNIALNGSTRVHYNYIPHILCLRDVHFSKFMFHPPRCIGFNLGVNLQCSPMPHLLVACLSWVHSPPVANIVPLMHVAGMTLIRAWVPPSALSSASSCELLGMTSF